MKGSASRHGWVLEAYLHWEAGRSSSNAGVHCIAAWQLMDNPGGCRPQGFPHSPRVLLSLLKEDGEGKSGGDVVPFLIK